MNKEEEREYWPRLVREAQKYGRLTVKELADALHVSERDVAYWKAGLRRPTGFVAVRFYQLRAKIISADPAYHAHLFISETLLEK